MTKPFEVSADVLVTRDYEVNANSSDHAIKIVEEGEVEHLREHDATSPMVTEVKQFTVKENK